MGEIEREPSPERALRIGDWLVDPASGELRRGAEAVRLQPKPMQVLLCLAGQPGRVFSKDELMEQVWGEVFVTDDAVWRSINGLRRALGDDPRAPAIIETLPRRGYRLVAEVRSARALSSAPDTAEEVELGARAGDSGAATPPAAGEPASASRWSSRRRRITVRAGLAVGLTCLALLPIADRLLQIGGPEAAMSVSGQGDSSPEEHLRIGTHAYQRLDEASLEEALEHFFKAVRIDPQLAAAHAAIATVRCIQATRRADDRDSLEEAIAYHAERALAIEPGLAEAHKARGCAYQLQGRIDLAVATYRRALALEPDSSAARNNLAAVLAERGELDEALRLFEQLAPSSPETLNLKHANLAIVHYLRHDFDAAAREATTVLAADPAYCEAAVVLARIDAIRGRLHDARQRLTGVLTQPSAQPLTFELAGLLELAAGAGAAHGGGPAAVAATSHETTARRYLELAIAGDSELYASRLGLALLAEREGDLVRAARLRTEVIDWAMRRLAGGDERWQPHHALAAAHALVGEEEQALARLRQAAERGFVDAPWLAVDPLFAGLGELRAARWNGAVGEAVERRAPQRK